MKKDNITITGVSDRIKNHISKLRASYSNIQFHISEAIANDVRLSSQHALNIFRIVQESIHNALKHSHAGNISIAINSNSVIEIQIVDDGRGMNVDSSDEGNGLMNMRARAKETGMQLLISSKPNEGTMVLLETHTTN